jgi:phage protein D
LTILADGRAFDEALQVQSVSVTKAVNRIASARIVLFDGDMATEDFAISSSETLRPGVEIEIKAGYGQQTSTIFKGLVVRHSIITGQNDSR